MVNIYLQIKNSMKHLKYTKNNRLATFIDSSVEWGLVRVDGKDGL